MEVRDSVYCSRGLLNRGSCGGRSQIAEIREELTNIRRYCKCEKFLRRFEECLEKFGFEFW
jgi:hypothetical protein